ncbi:MAG: hypothetical protein ACREDR_20190, partial [Blastocatellia bacterium]
MKRLVKILSSLIIALVFTLLIASAAARASDACLSVVDGADSNGSEACVLTGEDANWCYYDCTCLG